MNSCRVIEHSLKNGKLFSYYCRSKSRDRTALENQLVQLHDTGEGKSLQCCIFPSGMSAISAIFDVICRMPFDCEEPVILLSHELYCGTPKVANYYISTSKYKMICVDVRDEEKLLDIFTLYGDRIKLFFTESCSNPCSILFPVRLIPKIKTLAPKCILCVDNTWLSVATFNPMAWGFDLVVESMTKHLSGGTCISGMVVGFVWMDKLREWTELHGAHVSSEYCGQIQRAVGTVFERVSNASNIADRLASYLRTQPVITRLFYPRNESDEKLDTALTFSINGPTCIWFHVHSELSRNKLVKLLSRQQIFPLETSYGASYSRLDCYPKFKLSNAYDFEPTADAAPKPGVWLRISVGFKDSFSMLKDRIMKLLNEFS